MTEARDKFKAAAHAIIDAMPDGVRVSITVTGEHRNAGIAINDADQAIHKVLAENGRETTADSVHALTVEARKARDAVIERDAANLARHEAEKAAAELGAQLQALKVNPCSTCVRERDAARAERDEARRQGDVNFQELERQRRRAADLQAAHVASEKCIAEYRALVAKHEGDIKHIVSAYHDVGGQGTATADAVAKRLRSLSAELYQARIAHLVEACREAIIDAMPDGVRVSITVTGEHRNAGIAINDADRISWSSHSNAWPMMTAWGDTFMDSATPGDIAAKLYSESDKGETVLNAKA